MKYELATFGAGCFWCYETMFQQVNGVIKVESGYSGGDVENPSYEEVCSGKTGHAEVVQVTFDPMVISYANLLEIFWRIHDPTTLNRQGNDVGTQYRSVIFYHDEVQKKTAEISKSNVEESHLYDSKIVTEIVPFNVFYKAEDYHQNFYLRNPGQMYCKFVIDPKIQKFRKEFTDKLKVD